MIGKALLLIGVLALTLTAYKSLVPKQAQSDLKQLWSSWKAQYDRTYTSDLEDSHRFDIFSQNYAKVLAHNARTDVTYQLGLNKFADLTGEEFKATYTSGYVPQENSIGDQYCPSASPSCPSWPEPTQTSVNWTAAGAVTPIKNQGQCGGCWAFSTTGALEGLYFKTSGKLQAFSEQQLIDCVTTCDGCNGGLPSLAFAYTQVKGIETEQDYPFVGMDTACKYNADEAIHVNNGGFQCIPQKSVSDMQAAVIQQPVSIGVEADQNAWQMYAGGVLSSGCGANLDHAVTLTGFGSYQGTDGVWYVKNQWGTDWGINGYIYISQNDEQNTGFGVCGILRCGNIPLN